MTHGHLTSKNYIQFNTGHVRNKIKCIFSAPGHYTHMSLQKQQRLVCGGVCPDTQANLCVTGYTTLRSAILVVAVSQPDIHTVILLSK